MYVQEDGVRQVLEEMRALFEQNQRDVYEIESFIMAKEAVFASGHLCWRLPQIVCLIRLFGVCGVTELFYLCLSCAHVWEMLQCVVLTEFVKRLGMND